MMNTERLSLPTSTHRPQPFSLRAGAWLLALALCTAACGRGSRDIPQDIDGALPGGGTGAVAGAAGQLSAGTGGVPGAGVSGGAGMLAAGTGGGAAGSGAAGAAGTGSTAGTGGGNEVTASSFCQRLAEILCQAEVSCCQDMARKHATLDACISSELASCDSSIFTAPKTAFSPGDATTFLDGYEQRTQQCDPNVLTWASTGEGAFRVLQGTVAEGQSCSPSGLNDTAAAFACMSGSACRAASLFEFTCEPPGATGAECWTPLNCQDGYCNCGGTACDPAMDIGMGVCAARKADGETCSEAIECQSLVCQSGQCAPTTQDNVYCLGG